MIPFLDIQAGYQRLKDPIEKRLQEVFRHGAFILGPEVMELEEALAKFVDSRYCLTCSSGTSALQLAITALGIGPGDEVITTPFSFVAPSEAIALAGATPVYVDIEPKTYNINASKIKKAITPKTRAIIPVSLFGQPSDMNEIHDLAQSHKLFVIEDGAQSFGAKYRGRHSPNLGHIGITSFFPAKPLGAYGDGGALFTNDKDLAEKIRLLANHGQSSRYHYTKIGWNARLNTLQAAILLAKLPFYEKEIKQRQDLAQKYSQAFKSSNLTLPLVKEDRTSVWAQYTLASKNRDKVCQKLKDKGVPTSIHYPTTLPEEPAYKNCSRSLSLTQAKKASKEVFSIPLYPDLDEKSQDFIINTILSES